ncbi:glycosyltransferase family 2 protein [Paracoccus liaowanqingii]|uniref:glycosyltransferase family 2 protein n=1 Tax=Paracoccus liaowanqingii TaxID=2560053 RepID=UPI00159B9141|nr:glycosyltransferase family 2 protein [Paracoccus liaowanqingii]
MAVFTMSYNEDVTLPIWVKYYGGLFGRENLFVIDHGSNDGSTEGLHGVNLIKLPRTAFSDLKRSKMISDLCENFLNFYDYFIYTDTDEFLCVDPSKHKDLKTYLQEVRPEYETAIGLNIFHSFDEEPEFNSSRKVLSQRNYVYFMASMCKTLITKEPIKWGGGFHTCDKRQSFGEVYNFHSKFMDRGIALDRLRVLRNIPRDGNFGNHQMILDHDLMLAYAQINSRHRGSDFEFSENINELLSLVELDASGKYVYDLDYNGDTPYHLRKIPETFKGVF